MHAVQTASSISGCFVIVIGGSAGSFLPIKHILAGLPLDIEAAVFVVMHVGTSSMLPEVLQRSTSLPVSYARDGEPIVPGRVYIAQPDFHLLVDEERMLVARGPLENRARPAIDALFRSAAYMHGQKVAGVLLSGCLSDGTAGLWAIKQRGGKVLVQSPSDAEFAPMPASAIEHVATDYVVPHAAIAPKLVELSRAYAARPRSVVEDEAKTADGMHIETRIAAGEHPLKAGVLALGEPSRFSCPSCQGVLAQIREGTHVRFRCHTGHAYSLQSLLHESTQQGETILTSALRVLEETMLLIDLMLKNGGDEAQVRELKRRKSKIQKEIEAVHALVREAAVTDRSA